MLAIKDYQALIQSDAAAFDHRVDKHMHDANTLGVVTEEAALDIETAAQSNLLQLNSPAKIEWAGKWLAEAEKVLGRPIEVRDPKLEDCIAQNRTDLSSEEIERIVQRKDPESMSIQEARLMEREMQTGLVISGPEEDPEFEALVAATEAKLEWLVHLPPSRSLRGEGSERGDSAGVAGTSRKLQKFEPLRQGEFQADRLARILPPAHSHGRICPIEMEVQRGHRK
jgi:hypothetical protein